MALTPDFSLPYPEPNATANVPRDFKALAEAVESAMKDLDVDVIDAYDSTDKTLPPSADALRRGLETKQNVLRLADNYLAASVLVNAAPDAQGRAYPDGVSMFKVSSSAGGWPTANGYVLTFRTGSGGYQIFYEMYVGTVQTDKTARQWTRSKRDSNAFWQDWARGLTEADQAIITYWANMPVDTRTVNAAPNTYRHGVTREFKQGSAIGLPGESYVYLETSRPWVDDSAGLTLQKGFGMQTGRMYRRTGNASTWNAWDIDPTFADVSLRPPNLIRNPTGVMGLFNWNPKGNISGWSTSLDAYMGSLFYQNEASGTDYRIMDSAAFSVIPGTTYTLGANFSGGAAAGEFYVEVRGVGEVAINSIANNAGFWHRKSITFTIPANVSSVYIRLGVVSNKAAVQRLWGRLSLVLGSIDVYNDDMDGELLFQSVSNGKTSLKTAVTAKGGTVTQAGSVPTFAELTAGVNTIVPRKYTYVGLGTMFAGDSRTVNIGFVPRIVVISGISNTGGNRQTSMYWLNPSNTSDAAGSIGTLSLQGHNATNTTLTAFASVNTGNYSSVIVEAWQ